MDDDLALGQQAQIPRGFWPDSNSDVDLFIIHKKDSYPKHIEYGNIFFPWNILRSDGADNDDLG